MLVVVVIIIVITVIGLKWVELETRISVELGQQLGMELDYRTSVLSFSILAPSFSSSYSFSCFLPLGVGLSLHLLSPPFAFRLN